jgi:hypothetical protein
MAKTFGASATLLNGATDISANIANNNASNLSTSANYDNSGGGANQYDFATIELVPAFNAAPTVGNYVVVYFIPAPDGTNYDDTVAAAATTPPSANYQVAVLPVVTTSTTGKLSAIDSPLPKALFKAQLFNASGVQLNTTSVLKMIPWKFS